MTTASATRCPFCGSSALELWTSLVRPMGELLVCENCEAELATDGVTVLKPPQGDYEKIAPGKPSTDGRKKRVVKKVIRRRKKVTRKVKASEEATESAAEPTAESTREKATAKASRSRKSKEAPPAKEPRKTFEDPTLAEDFAAARERFPGCFVEDGEFTKICLNSPRKRFFKMMTHDLTDAFEVPQVCVLTGTGQGLREHSFQAANQDVVMTMELPVSKDEAGSKLLADAVQFEYIEDDNVFMFAARSKRFIIEFAGENEKSLIPLEPVPEDTVEDFADDFEDDE